LLYSCEPVIKLAKNYLLCHLYVCYFWYNQLANA
jgi:hypothetical protein